MDIGEIGWAGIHGIGLTHDGDKMRDLVNAVMSLRILENSGRFLSGRRIGGFYVVPNCIESEL
jgi:hypothetical protein